MPETLPRAESGLRNQSAFLLATRYATQNRRRGTVSSFDCYARGYPMFTQARIVETNPEAQYAAEQGLQMPPALID